MASRCPAHHYFDPTDIIHEPSNDLAQTSRTLSLAVSHFPWTVGEDEVQGAASHLFTAKHMTIGEPGLAAIA